MPPKRAGEQLSIEKAEKWQKLTDEEAVKVEDDLEKIEEPEQANDQSAIEQLESYVLEGNKTLVRHFLDHQTINLKTDEGGQLLWLAYYKDDRDEIVGMLVRHGVDLNARRYDDNRTILHHILRGYGVESKTTRDLFRLMLDHGADVDARDSEGKSLLHCAIASLYGGSIELAEELLKHGAQITINENDSLMDDICLATAKYKLELLPKLIQHQDPDEETRNHRAVIAINSLIAEMYTGVKGAAAVQMMKKILDLGVPVNVPEGELERRKISFLNKALWYKNKSAVKLLLEYGADPHQYDLWGNTTLYQATAFVGYTQVSRWLIERGVSIHAENNRGGYPIHGACEHESVRNLHLLLSLGADLSATGKYGRTAFSMMKMREKQKNREVHHLVIKHLALTIARNEKINDRDVDQIDKCVWSRHHFDLCTEQLERMKVEKVYGNFSYFTLLSKNMYSSVQLVKNENFRRMFKRNEEKRASLFPQFFHMILHFFEIAEKRLEVLRAETAELYDVFRGTMPDHIVEKIAYYLSFEKLEHCQYDYFMAFHEKLTVSKANKAKIL